VDAVGRSAASFSLALFFTLVAVRVAGPTLAPFRPMVRLLVQAGILGTAITEVAMQYFLFGFDQSSAWKKNILVRRNAVPATGPLSILLPRLFTFGGGSASSWVLDTRY
jgi:hypothetical protein